MVQSLNQTVILLWRLCGETEVMGGKTTEIGGVANKYVMLIGKIIL